MGDRLSLMYLSDEGHFDRNDYASPHMTIGPLLRERTVEDWERALFSADQAEVLSALIWLSGYHWKGEPAPYDEDKADSAEASTLLARASVRKRLAELSESKDYWVQTAAETTLENYPK